FFGGRGGIRTHEELSPLAVFKTAAVGRLATLPRLMEPAPAAPAATRPRERRPACGTAILPHASADCPAAGRRGNGRGPSREKLDGPVRTRYKLKRRGMQGGQATARARGDFGGRSV